MSGGVPDWYELIRAARYSKTWTPEELAQKPTFWKSALLIAEAAEIEAQNMMAESDGRGHRGTRRR